MSAPQAAPSRSPEQIEQRRHVRRAKAAAMAKWSILCAIAVVLFGSLGLLYFAILRMDGSFWLTAPCALAFCFALHSAFDWLSKESFAQFDRFNQMQEQASVELERRHAIALAREAALREAAQIESAMAQGAQMAGDGPKRPSSAKRL